jgi:hypothetical protein
MWQRKSKRYCNHWTFPSAWPGLLGSHSIQKFTAMYARRNGCSRDDVDIRGQWKSNKRMVDICIDTNLPHSDAKVAENVGRAVNKYRLRRGSVISKQTMDIRSCQCTYTEAHPKASCSSTRYSAALGYL